MPKKTTKKDTAKTETPKPEVKDGKAAILQAIKEMPKASNLVVDNKRYETVKRDEVVELLKRML